MKISIMQPYFFPYLGYFSLINSVNKFLFLNDVQFIRHGWVNRNRILKQYTDWQYILIPVQKHNRNSMISEIKIANDQKWVEKIYGQLTGYKKRAPYYSETKNFIINILESNQWNLLWELNYITIKAICEYIGITTQIEVFDSKSTTLDSISEPDDWALQIMKRMPEYDHYINPIGGTSFFNKEKYTNEGFKLNFLKYNHPKYNQKNGAFIENLSIIDVLMYNNPNEINNMLNLYEFI